MKTIYPFLIFFLSLPSLSKAQFRENQFIFNVVAGFEFPAFIDLKNEGKSIKTSFPLNNKKINGFGPIQNYFAGFHLTYHRPSSFFGANLETHFFNRSINLLQPEITNHSALGVRPQLLFKLRNNNIEKVSHPFFSFGGAYNYHFSYQELDTEKNKLNKNSERINNGFTGIIGFGIEIIPSYYNERENRGRSSVSRYATGNSYLSIAILYHHDFFDFFNVKYLENEKAPFQSFSNNFGYLSIQFIGRGVMRLNKEINSN